MFFTRGELGPENLGELQILAAHRWPPLFFEWKIKYIINNYDRSPVHLPLLAKQQRHRDRRMAFRFCSPPGVISTSLGYIPECWNPKASVVLFQSHHCDLTRLQTDSIADIE